MRIRVGVQFGVRGAAVPSQLHSFSWDLPVVASEANDSVRELWALLSPKKSPLFLAAV